MCVVATGGGTAARRARAHGIEQNSASCSRIEMRDKHERTKWFRILSLIMRTISKLCLLPTEYTIIYP